MSFFCKIISISIVLLSGTVLGGDLTDQTEIQTAQFPINSRATYEANQNSDFPLDVCWKYYVEERDHPLKALMLTRASFRDNREKLKEHILEYAENKEFRSIERFMHTIGETEENVFLDDDNCLYRFIQITSNNIDPMHEFPVAFEQFSALYTYLVKCKVDDQKKLRALLCINTESRGKDGTPRDFPHSIFLQNTFSQETRDEVFYELLTSNGQNKYLNRMACNYFRLTDKREWILESSMPSAEKMKKTYQHLRSLYISSTDTVDQNEYAQRISLFEEYNDKTYASID